MGSNADLTLDNIVIRRVTSLAEPKLQEIVDVYIEAYWDDIYRGPIVRREDDCGRYMASGMYCTAIMNGLALVAERKKDGKVIGGSGFFIKSNQPSSESENLFGSEEQARLSGYKTMHELMSADDNKLWDQQNDLWLSLIAKGAPNSQSSDKHGLPFMQLFVAPTAQRRGIGTKLVNESLKVFVTLDDPQAYVFLGAYKHSTIRLYERLGFNTTVSEDGMPLELEKADGSPRKCMRVVIMALSKNSPRLSSFSNGVM